MKNGGQVVDVEAALENCLFFRQPGLVFGGGRGAGWGIVPLAIGDIGRLGFLNGLLRDFGELRRDAQARENRPMEYGLRIARPRRSNG